MNSKSSILAPRTLTRLLLAAFLAACPARAEADDPLKASVLTDSQKGRMKERDHLDEQARKLQAEGKLPEAIAAAEAMLAIECDVLGEESEDAIGSYLMLAELHRSRDDWPASTAARARVLDLRTRSLGAAHWKTIEARSEWERAEAVGRLDRDGRRRFAEVGTWNAKFRDLYARGRLARAMQPARQALELNREVLGERHIDTITSLGNLAMLLQVQGQLDEARPMIERALKLSGEVLGERHPTTITLLNNLAALLRARNDLDAARPLYKRALKLSEEVLGERDPATIRQLNNLATLLLERGDLDAARPMLERTLKLREATLGERHSDTIDSLANLALLLQNRGDLDAARPLIERALKLSAEVLGERHPTTLAAMHNLATLMQARGDLHAARPLYERALQLREEVLGERHVDTVTNLGNLATLLTDLGDLDAARPLHERALHLKEATLGKRDPRIIASLSNLATLLQAQGDLDAARSLHERALALSRESGRERHPETITILNNMAMLMMDRGDLDAARPLAERVVRLREEVQGERHPDTIKSLNNLAALLQARGEFMAAGATAMRAFKLSVEVHGERHPMTIASLSNLTRLLHFNGDIDVARPAYERALELGAEVQGERHPNTISILNNLAELLHERGDLDGARPMLERSLRLRREVLGERHSDTIAALVNLAALLTDLGDLDAARELSGRSLAASESRLGSSLPGLTVREQLALLRASRSSLDFSLNLSSGRLGDDASAYAGVLAIKGLVAEADLARRLAGRPEARDLRLRLVPMRARLNALAYARVPADRADEHARSVRSMAEEIAALELALARAVDWSPRAPEAARVAASLPAGVGLVDLFRYESVPLQERGKPRVPGYTRYVAFVVRPGVAPVRVELGPSAPIDEAVASWRARLQQGGEADELGRSIAKLVWEPLVPHLGDARTVLISPDGDLAFLPWAALPDGDRGSCLLRRLAFGVIPSARQLVSLAEWEPKPAPGGLLAVGGVNYGKAEPGEPVAVASRSAAVGRSALAFGALPGTDVEARAVAALYRATHHDAPAVEAPAGAGATKGRLASAMPGKRFLHLATHGYFAPPEFKNALAPEDDRTSLKAGEGMGRAEVTGFYPGLLSGLAWAGAASPKTNPSSSALDVGAGLMTAEEVGGLDLKGCELAVLSACETGLGRTAGGEGVLGLQRAFHQAGAMTVVASLWKVDDDATRELMTRFYRNLWEKKLLPLEAMRQAQLSILDDPNFGDGGNPRLWAAWTLSGDPGSLTKLETPAEPTPGSKK